MIKVKKTRKVREKDADRNVLSMYLMEINKIPLLSREDESKIAQAAAMGDAVARQRLVKSNLRFVVNVAKKYQGQGLPLADLISEGNVGLLNAVDRFDVNRGYHFISYAVWWIRQSILKAICEKSRMIRLPLNRANELVRIEHARKYVTDQSAEGSIREISEMLNMDRELVIELVNISQEMVSLDLPLQTGNDTSVLVDFIEDSKTCSPVQSAVISAAEKDIENVLGTLNEKEANIIRYRYGLGKRTPMSLKEIGDCLNLTKERIRQIEKKAVSRLKHPSRRSKLQGYVA